MVPMDLGPHSIERVELAAGLADKFGALLIGLAARQPDIGVYADITVPDERLVQEEVRRVGEELTQAEALFRKAADRNAVEWRCATEWPTIFALEQARAADLIVVGRQGPEDDRDWRFAPHPGDLVMSAGRPILVAPPRVRQLSARRIVVAWKDTREARRAVWDALPLLKAADHVFIVSVGSEVTETALVDVNAYLSRHGVPATTELRRGSDRPVADEVLAVVEGKGADLIVAGGYCHSRMREWIFGGVTRDLLARMPVCCLLAH